RPAVSVRLKPDTTSVSVRLKPDTTSVSVRLKPDTTSVSVRLKPDTTSGGVASGRTADLLIELGDQPIPRRDGVDQALPETLATTPFEVVDADALLLDPGVVTQVENPR